MSEPDFLAISRITILGVGLMSGSLALALRGSWQEINVPGGLPRCIRDLLHWNTEIALHEIHHIYLVSAASFRPDFRKSDLP